ncbi:glycosyl hydrolase family 65 protein [Tetraselmis virus 1]|uniref:Glycosyl hydrolase family 65 protein n=1 Tax=Tetraselmis virus 1 TaxID=2060617 RepID=A0A2P0VNC6_9VIRU|nr:glycosyl hydrolase family 65 protein [Tetraselmis virus 1]AUF82411.1 glycosyl hydrolase family 65 protein [Tetraselmis virus 1]
MSDPIQLTLDTALSLTSTSASITVSAESTVLKDQILGQVHVGGSYFPEIGSTTQVTLLESSSGDVTYLDKTSGTMYVSLSDGIHVLRDDEIFTPSGNGFDLYMLSHPTPVTELQAQQQVINETYDPSTTDKYVNVYDTVNNVDLEVLNLSAGTSYDFSIHAYDSTNNVISTTFRTAATSVDPDITNFSSVNKITQADLSITTYDPDSSITVKIAVTKQPYESGRTPDDIAQELIDSTYSHSTGFYEAIHSLGTDTSTATFSNLEDGVVYTPVIVMVDSSSGQNYTDCNNVFFTYSRPEISSIIEDLSKRAYTSTEAVGSFEFTNNNTTVLTSIVPNNPTAINDFIVNGTDPLGNLTTTNYAFSGNYSLEFTGANLLQNVDYAAVVKVQPNIQPDAYASSYAVVTVALPPVTTIFPPFSLFFYGQASFVVTDPDDTINVYAAIHPDTDTPEEATQKLLQFGSLAYPNSIVAVGESSYSNVLERNDLEPDSRYYVTVVGVESLNNSLVNTSSTFFWTFPVPEISLSAGAFTDTAIQTFVTTEGESHNTFVYITPYVYNGSVIYDVDTITQPIESTSNTYVILDTASNEVYPSWSNLIENTQYGVVLLVSQPLDNEVLNERSIIMKTAALPDISVNILGVTYDDVSYRVSVDDEDSAFRVLSAVSTQVFSETDAESFVAAGMSYTGSGIVNGTQNDYPGDSNIFSVDFVYTACNLLSSDTQYNAVAVVVDEESDIISWSQSLFMTDFRPIVELITVEPTSDDVKFSVEIEDRDGPYLTIRYNAYPTNVGIDEEFIRNDGLALTTVSNGSGRRLVTDLIVPGLNPGQSYYLGVIAISPDGTASDVIIPTSLAPFTTDILPGVTVTLSNVLRTEILAGIDSELSGTMYDSVLAVAPGGTVFTNEMISEIFAGTSTVVTGFQRYNDNTGSFSASNEFSGLTEGTQYVIVAASGREDNTEDYSWDSIEDYTRVSPELSSGTAALGTQSYSVTVDLRYVDPKGGRTNNADLIVSLMPTGCNSYDWMQYGVTENPVLPGVSILSRQDIDSFNGLYSTSNLNIFDTYDLVIKAYDSNVLESFYDVTSFITRDQIDITTSLGSIGSDSAFFDVTVSLSDGTFDLYVNNFLDTNGGVASETMINTTVTTGIKIVDELSFYNSVYEVTGLLSGNDYIVVFVAVDNISGEKFSSYNAFTSTSVLPTINIVNGSGVISSSSATFSLVAGDTDSMFTCYTKAYVLADADPVDETVINNTISDPDYSRLFQSSSVTTPFSVTVTGLNDNTTYRFVAVVQDAITLSNVYDFEDFTTIPQEDYLESTEYDGAYTLTWRSDATYTLPQRGVLMANGKVSFRTRLDNVMGLTDIYLSGSFDFNSYGGYTNNLVEAFDPYTISLYDASVSENAASFALSNQVLNMQNAVVTNSGRFIHENGIYDVEQDIMSLRNMPFCILSMYRLTPSSNVDSVMFFHEVSNSENLDNVEYDATTVYQPSLSLSMQMLQSEAGIKGSTHRVASSSVYLFDTDNIDVNYVGFNSFRNYQRGFNAFSFSNLVAGETYNFAILTAQASTSDFPYPKRESTRLVTQVIGSQITTYSRNLYNAATRLRANHVSAWNDAWFTSVTLTPKDNISVDDNEEFNKIKRALRYSQFQLFSSVQQYSGSDLNPLTLTSVDVDGNIFWNRELWVVPALLYTKPKSVRAMIENRYNSLRDAKNLAGAQGYEGARYPYAADINTYIAAPYWDVASASYVFNSALVSTCTWDYYRATHDKDWLIMKGFQMVASIADYICSNASIDDDNVTSFPDVLDVNGEKVTDPSWTLYICRMALKAAIESCYELNYPIRQPWIDTYQGIYIKFFPYPNQDIVKQDSSSELTDLFRLLEPLFMMHPHYIADFARYDVPRTISTEHTTLIDNYDFYSSVMETDYMNNPFNTILRMCLLAQVNRTTGTYSDTVNTLLLKFIDDSTQDIWGSMSADATSQYNDVSVCALFALTFMNCFAGLHVSGGVSQSGYYYEPFGIRAATTSYLPDYWQNVIVTSGDKITRNIVNRTLYE